MQVPLHPMMVHLPMALTFIMPTMIIIFGLMIKSHKMSPKAWLIIIGLQAVVVTTGYIALETGENEERTVQQVVAKSLIGEHEEAAEIFVGSTVLVLALSIGVFFVRREIAFPVKLGITVVSLISCFLAYRTGLLGGELVYKHNAASAYMLSEDSEINGLLPTPGMNTSESPMPVNENESLKADDNDYGHSDEIIENVEDFKQED